MGLTPSARLASSDDSRSSSVGVSSPPAQAPQQLSSAMSYILSFGQALLHKLAPHVLDKEESTDGSVKFYRASWRSDVLFPWDLQSNEMDDVNVTSALFINVTFDMLQSKDVKVAIRVGALIALPVSGESSDYTYHYVQSAPLTESEIHAHCKSIDVDTTTQAGMVADLVGAALLEKGVLWKCARRERPNGKTENGLRNDKNSDVCDDQWELKVSHINQLQGEVGYLPLSKLGQSLNEQTLDMILLSSPNPNRCSLSYEQGKQFWENFGVQDITQTNNAPETKTIVPNQTKIHESKLEETSCDKQHECKRQTKTDSTVYAHSRKRYIAGSKKKKPKFTLGSI